MNKLKRCLNCNKIFDRPLRSKQDNFKISWVQYGRRKFCSNKCRGEWRSKNNTGENNYNWKGGKSICIDCGKELSVRYYYSNAIRCRECSSKFRRGENHQGWKGGKPKCVVCGKVLSNYNGKICKKCYCGKYRPSWKGGISPLYALIRTLPQSRKWYLSVFYRDNYTCQICGKRDRKFNSIVAHHLKGFALILKENKIETIEQAIKCKELWDISNGQTLCRKCHRLTDSFGKKIS